MKNLVLLLLLGVMGCAPTFSVYTDHDPQTDVRLFSRYRWLEADNIEAGQNPLYYNSLNDRRIKEAVAEQLDLGGYTFDQVQPDFVVHYHIVVKEKGVVYTEELGYRYSRYWTNERLHLYQYSEGTIIIDIMDAKTNDLIWRGWAVSVLDYENAEGIQRVIRSSIQKIFVGFPHSFDLNSKDHNF